MPDAAPVSGSAKLAIAVTATAQNPAQLKVGENPSFELAIATSKHLPDAWAMPAGRISIAAVTEIS